MDWYVRQNKKQFNMTWEQLCARWKDGSINSDDLIWHQILKEWTRAQDVPGLPRRGKLADNPMFKPTIGAEKLNKIDNAGRSIGRMGSILTLILTVPLVPLFGLVLFGVPGLFVGIAISIFFAVTSIRSLKK